MYFRAPLSLEKLNVIYGFSWSRPLSFSTPVCNKSPTGAQSEDCSSVGLSFLPQLRESGCSLVSRLIFFLPFYLHKKLQRNLSTRLHNFKRKISDFYFIFFSSSPFTFFIVSSNQRWPAGEMPRCTRLLSSVVWPDSHQQPRKKINNTLSGGKKRKTVKHDSALTVAASTHFQAINLSVRHFSDKGGTERKYCAGRERKRRTPQLQPCGVA